MLKKKMIAAAMMLSMTLGGAATLVPAAEARDYQGYNRYNYYNRDRGLMGNHPYVQKAVIGGGVGAVAGGLLAGDGGRADGAIKGGLLGAGLGLGYQYLRNQGTFRNW
jgi:hypothetical protein